ncbi:hypothetical protein GDO81_016652 [Engystomops pustulosus]|nr:hypothetical protein GDO81_016652 [Engystomops pustulosus]
MRELEAAATKDIEGSLRRSAAQEEEVQLMEERKNRKNDKKKKEAASKKASDQKNKVPEQILSQPQPVNGNSGISTVTSIQNNNAKRPTALASPQPQQQAVSRYPREVPPRFRHQEQKPPVKRGQQIPGIAASLGLATKVLNQESESSSAVCQERTSPEDQPGMPPIRDLVSHSPNQLDINHGSLGSHYESSHWGSVSSNGDPGTTWDKVIVDGTDKEAWPSITGSSPDLASECMDIESTANCGLEKGHIVPFGENVGEMDTVRNGIGHSSQSKILVGSNSNNAGNGSINGPWGVTHGPMISTCQDGPDSKSDSRHNRINAWGTVNNSMNGVVNPSTLNMNGNRGAWPVLDSNGHTHKGSNNTGTNVPSSTIGQVSNNRCINPKMGSSNPGSWGNIQENGSESEVNGTRKASYGGQPQNLNTEMTGPNNTTNFMTSSLPNSAGLMQTNELPHSTGHGAWSVGTMNHSPLHTTSVTNGTSIPHLSNGEETNGGSYGTTWGTSGSNYSGDKSSVPKGQANGDTVNATIMQPGMNGPSGPNFKTNGNKGGVWESGTVNSQNMHWGSENGGTSGGNQRGWGNPAQNTGTNIANGDWNKPNNQHSNEGEMAETARKASNTWKSAEEENAGQNPTGSRGNETSNVWAKSTGTGESEGSVDSTGSQSEQSVDRRKVDQQTLLQSIVNRGDLDPRVLCNTGWGQTPIRQNTAWNIEAASPRSDRKTDNGTEAWGASVSKTSNSGGWVEKPNPNSNDTSSVSGWGDPKPATGWGDAKGSVSQGEWGDQFAATTGTVKSNQSWGNGKEDKSTWNDAQKVKQGWGGQSNDGWGENSKSNHWGAAKSSSSSDSDKSSSGWGETRSNSWGSVNANNNSGWVDSSKANASQGWAEPAKMNQGGGDASKCGPPRMESDHLQSEWGKKPETGSWGGPPANNKPSGWLGGPMSTPTKDEEPTGWEEPSPESIRRKMEIDDGTAAWGDPNQYKYKNVNMWDKNTSNTSSTGAEHPPQGHHLPPPTSAVPNKESSSGSGWGDTWQEPAAPAVDNGTAAWGKPMETGGGWGEQNSEMTSSSWSHTPIGQQAPGKPGPKSMQDSGWCGDEMTGTGGRGSGWDDDDVEIGMWNSNASQESNWPPYMKKMPSKGNMKNGNKPDDGWMNPFVKQFNNMGFSRESPDDTSQSNKMDISGGLLPDKRMDLDKSGLIGDYSRVIGKGPGPRHFSKESSMDHNPYFDKNGNPNMYGVGNAAQARGPQPPQAMNSSQPNLRAQVPPNMMPPQVPPSLLKYPPNNTGMNPLFGPQQVAMLNQLSQLTQLSQLSQINQISQLQRLLAQQQKVQNQRGGLAPGGRLQQEQQVRSMGMQQQQQQSRQLDPSLLMKQAMPPSQQQMLHQPPVKSFLDNVLPHSTPELPKVPSPINAFNGFSLGLNSNVNMDLGGMKEPQSRLRKWTTVDNNMSPNNSLDQNSSKHGAISSGFRLEDSPFGSYDFMNSSNSPSSPPGSIGDGWPSAKSPNGSSSVNWPPEFRPGEPWKGYPNIDPETDPYVTPGSVLNNLSISTVRGVDHLRDRNSGSSSSLNTTLPSNSAWSSIRASNYNVSHSSTAQSTSVRNSDPKPTWSPGPVSNTSLAHELWKVPLPSKSISAPSRPPPGLTGQKPPLSAWDNGSLRLGSGWGTSDSRYTPGSTWSDNSSGRITNWLVLKNLTPQIDGSTLRTLCMQHGPLITFHLNLPHGTALVRYSSKEEVVKAQKSLHM